MSAKPQLTIEGIEDQVVRQNFDNLRRFFTEQNQLQDFQFVEFTTSQAETNLKVAHNLGFKPKDIIRSRVTPDGVTVTFNHDKFDTETVDVTTDGAVRFRGFIGTYRQDTSTEEVAASEPETV